MTEQITTRQHASYWVLTYRKTGYTQRFSTLEAARNAQIRAAARYGTRWLSLRPERA